MKLWALFYDRVEKGPISDEQFHAILAAAVEELEAAQPKRRRRRRGRPPAPLDPLSDAALDALLEEL